MQGSRRWQVALLILVSVLLLAACGSGRSTASAHSGRSTASAPHRYRTAAIVLPRRVTGTAEASALLPFKVVLPSDPKATATQLGVYVKAKQLDGFYESPSEGSYTLSEGFTRETVADLEQLAHTWKAGHTEIQGIDGVHVLVQEDGGGKYRTVSWIRGDGTSPVLTFLQGPHDAGQSFTKKQALSVAADLISRGG